MFRTALRYHVVIVILRTCAQQSSHLPGSGQVGSDARAKRREKASIKFLPRPHLLKIAGRRTANGEFDWRPLAGGRSLPPFADSR
jgi:hypothetical protein